MKTMNLRRACGALGPAALALLFALPAFGEESSVSARAILEEARLHRTWDPGAIAAALAPASPRRIAELRLLLADEDPSFRAGAARVLPLLGDRPVQTLARLLKDEDKDVRRAAEESLGAAGAPAVEPLGEILLNESCLSPSVTAAARALGRIGDPGGVLYLSGALVKFRGGGFPQQIGMQALREIGGTEAVAQLLQFTTYKELGEEAYRALMAMDPEILLRTVRTLLDDPVVDPQLRFGYALQLNEVVGTVAAAAVLLKFFADVAAAADLPPEVRKKGTMFGNLFAKADANASYYRKPLTQQRLNIMFALKKEDEESPFIEARRRQEREMDEIRAERGREAARASRIVIIGPYLIRGPR